MMSEAAVDTKVRPPSQRLLSIDGLRLHRGVVCEALQQEIIDEVGVYGPSNLIPLPLS